MKEMKGNGSIVLYLLGSMWNDMWKWSQLGSK